MGQCCAHSEPVVEKEEEEPDKKSGLIVTVKLVDQAKVCIKWRDKEGRFPPITVKYKHTNSDAYNFGQISRPNGVCYIGGLKTRQQYEFQVRSQLSPMGDLAFGKPMYIYTDNIGGSISRVDATEADDAPPEDDRPKSGFDDVLSNKASYAILSPQKSTVNADRKSASFFQMKSDKVEPSSSRIDWPTLEHPMPSGSPKAPSPSDWPSRSNTMLPPLQNQQSDNP